MTSQVPGPDLQTVIRAIEEEGISKREYKGIGRKPHDAILLTALTYLMVRNGWSLRDAERWCKANMKILRQLGYDKPNPPSRMAFKKMLDSMDPNLIQRITAKIKYLRGELKTLWF
jgi:hypothetical protein